MQCVGNDLNCFRHRKIKGAVAIVKFDTAYRCLMVVHSISCINFHSCGSSIHQMGK